MYHIDRETKEPVFCADPRLCTAHPAERHYGNITEAVRERGLKAPVQDTPKNS